MTDTEEALNDLANDLSLPVAVIQGVCSELARNPDHAQKLQLCQQWGISWPELQRLADMRKPDLEALGKGLATQGVMLSSIAQGALAKKLSDPVTILNMEPKELSSIAKQQSDIALSWTKEASLPSITSNTINLFSGSSVQDIVALKALKQNEKPALARLLEKVVTIPAEASTDVNDY